MVVQRKNTKTDPDLDKWLSRNEAADLIGVSGVTLANYERKGILHPRKVWRPDRRGVPHELIVYDPHELAKIPRRSNSHLTPRDPGEMAARCFEMFDRGATLREVVIDQREHPDKVRDLQDKWLDMGGANLVISPSAKEMLEEVLGAFTSVAELVERVQSYAERLHTNAPEPATTNCD